MVIAHNKYSAEDIDRKLLSTDNYIEKYLPIKIHKFIMSTLKNIFDNKKDIKKLRDYEAKKDWLLNEAVRNDNGIPSDFKKKIPDGYNKAEKDGKPPRKARKYGSNQKYYTRVEDSPSSQGGLSFLPTSNKQSDHKEHKSKRSDKSSNHSDSKESKKHHHHDSKSKRERAESPSLKSSARSRHKSHREHKERDDSADQPDSSQEPKERMMTIEVRDENDLPKHFSKHSTSNQPDIHYDDSIRLEEEGEDEGQSHKKQSKPRHHDSFQNQHDQSVEHSQFRTNSKQSDLVVTEVNKKQNESQDVGKVQSIMNNNERDHLHMESQSEEFSPSSVHNDQTPHHEEEDEKLEISQNSSNLGEGEHDHDDDYELYGRRNSKTDLIAMHELDDEFTIFLKELSNDAKNLKKDVEMLKNAQNNMKSIMDSSIKNVIQMLTEKIDRETSEQKEYIKSLHQDIDEIVKRAKRDRSDNYLDINKLSDKVKVIEIRSSRIEEHVMKSVALYSGVLENIRMHLKILKHSNQKVINDKIEKDNKLPYVAAEGDLLSQEHRSKSKMANSTTYQDELHNVSGLEEELNRLEQIMKENNHMLELNMKEKTEDIEEQKLMYGTMKSENRASSPESRLQISRKRVIISPKQHAIRPSLGSMKLGEEYRIAKYPDFGPFKNKDSIFSDPSNLQCKLFNISLIYFLVSNPNDRKLTASSSVKWNYQLSPNTRHFNNIMPSTTTRRVEVSR